MTDPRIELRRRLYLDNEEETPHPGFPSHTELVIWAKTQDVALVRDEALTILGEPGWPAQYAAMGLLRALGIEVDGLGYEEEFRWHITFEDGTTEVIVAGDDA